MCAQNRVFHFFIWLKTDHHWQLFCVSFYFSDAGTLIGRVYFLSTCPAEGDLTVQCTCGASERGCHQCSMCVQCDDVDSCSRTQQNEELCTLGLGQREMT